MKSMIHNLTLASVLAAGILLAGSFVAVAVNAISGEAGGGNIGFGAGRARAKVAQPLLLRYSCRLAIG